MSATDTFRVVTWIAADGQSEVMLTTYGMGGMSAADLIAEARREIERTGLVREDGDKLVMGECDGRSKASWAEVAS
jgi:hypothetical protein